MITEKGSIKVATEHTAQMNKELNKTTIILGVVYAVVGGIMLLTSTIIYAIKPSAELPPYLWIMLGTVLMIFGITICGTAKNINKRNGVNAKVEEAEFFEGYLINREYENGEHLVTAKIYYNRLVRIKETKNYLFLYNTRVTAVAVDKNKVTDQELNGIRSLLGRPVHVATANVNAVPTAEQTQPEAQENVAEGQAEKTFEKEQSITSDNSECK